MGRENGKYDVFIRQGLAKHMQELAGIDKNLVKLDVKDVRKHLPDKI